MDRFGFVLLLIFGLANAAVYQLPTPPACGVMDGDMAEGETVGLHEFPWIVWISYGNTTKGTISCAGVLISPRHVITAARCMEGYRYSLYFGPSVFLGEHNLATKPDCVNDTCNPGVHKTHAQTYSFPSEKDYDTTYMKGNIAVLRLGSDFEMSQTVRPICMPKAIENFTSSSTSDILYVSGWPKGHEYQWGETEKAKKALRVVDQPTCEATFKLRTSYRRSLDKTNFCVKGDTALMGCFGFSGSPLMKKVGDYWVMEGLFNDKFNCHNPSGTFVASKITDYEEWIDSVLDNNY